MQGFIYLIENKINGKKYVGQTLIPIGKRFKEHIQDSRRKNTEKRPLYDAIRKYGVDNFQYSLLEECDSSILNDREVFWISEMNTYVDGYNATLGGEGKNNYDWNKIIESYSRLRSPIAVAKEIGCCSDTVVRVLEIRDVSRDMRLEKGLSHGNAIIAIQNDRRIKLFISQLKAAEWIEEQGKTVIKDLRKVSYIIGRAARGLDNRKQAYGYKWEFISQQDYLNSIE